MSYFGEWIDDHPGPKLSSTLFARISLFQRAKLPAPYLLARLFASLTEIQNADDATLLAVPQIGPKKLEDIRKRTERALNKMPICPHCGGTGVLLISEQETEERDPRRAFGEDRRRPEDRRRRKPQ